MMQNLIFSFLSLVKQCLKIKLKDVETVIRRLQKLIDIFKKNYIRISRYYFEIMKITIVIRLLKEILEVQEKTSDKDKALFEVESGKIVQKTSRLIFLSKILEIEELFIPHRIITLFNISNEEEEQNLFNLIKTKNKFINSNDEDIYNCFKGIIELLKENKNYLRIINKIFPFYKIEKNKKKNFLILWLDLFE